MPNLVDALNEQTGITAKVDEHLFLDSQELFRTPFVYITANEAFELTEREMHNLARTCTTGVLSLSTNATPTLEFSQAEASLRRFSAMPWGPKGLCGPFTIRIPFTTRSTISTVRPSVRNCRSAPLPNSEGQNFQTIAASVYNLEGIFLNNRLVGIYSDKGYVHNWAQLYGNEPQLRFGINAVIFALTQEGSIAQQQIDFYSQVTSQ